MLLHTIFTLCWAWLSLLRESGPAGIWTHDLSITSSTPYSSANTQCYVRLKIELSLLLQIELEAIYQLNPDLMPSSVTPQVCNVY